MLEEAPGEEDSETRSSPSRKGDKRDTIISSKKQDSSIRDVEANKVKSVPKEGGLTEREEEKAELMARTEPAKKPEEIKVDEEAYSSNRRQSQGVEKPAAAGLHLPLDSPHSDMLLKSINTEDLAKLDEVEIDSKRPSGSVENKHIKSYGALETAAAVNKEEEKKQAVRVEDEDEEDEEEESEESEEEGPAPMRPEKAIVMSISQTE